MNPQLRILLDLQKIDSDLHYLRNLRERRPLEVEKERAKVEQAEEGVEAIEAAMKRLRMECDKGELEVRQSRAEAEKLQVALNTAKTNQEYQVLTDQIERLKTQIEASEEGVLEGLGQIDALAAEREKAQAKVEEARRELAEREEELADFLAEIDGKIAALQEQREAKVEGVDPEALRLYQRVLGRYEDSALAPVEGRVCQGCNMSVTTQAVSELMLGSDLVQCKQCMRILYLPETVAR